MGGIGGNIEEVVEFMIFDFSFEGGRGAMLSACPAKLIGIFPLEYFFCFLVEKVVVPIGTVQSVCMYIILHTLSPNQVPSHRKGKDMFNVDIVSIGRSHVNEYFKKSQ